MSKFLTLCLSCCLSLALAYHPGFLLSHMSLKGDPLLPEKAGIHGARKAGILVTQKVHHATHKADLLDTKVDALAAQTAAVHADRKADHLDHKADLQHAADKVDHLNDKAGAGAASKAVAHAAHKADHLHVGHSKVAHLSTHKVDPLHHKTLAHAAHRTDLLDHKIDPLAGQKAVAHVSHKTALDQKAAAHHAAHKADHLDHKANVLDARNALSHAAHKTKQINHKAAIQHTVQKEHHLDHKADSLAAHKVLAHGTHKVDHLPLGGEKVAHLTAHKASPLHHKSVRHAAHKADVLDHQNDLLADRKVVAHAARKSDLLDDKVIAHHTAQKADHLDDKADALAAQNVLAHAADKADHIDQKAAAHKNLGLAPVNELSHQAAHKSVHSPAHKKDQPVTGCSPKEWEGEAFGQIVVGSPHSTAVSFESDVSVSHIWQMEVYDTVSEVTPKKIVRTTTYRDWKAGYEFEYNLDTKKCKVTKQLAGVMKRTCIGSDNVNYLRSFFVGNSLADMVETDDFGTNGKAITTMLRDSQIPVSVIATGKVQGSTQYLSMQYANVQIGIKDSEVFVIPDACMAALGAKDNP